MNKKEKKKSKKLCDCRKRLEQIAELRDFGKCVEIFGKGFSLVVRPIFRSFHISFFFRRSKKKVEIKRKNIDIRSNWRKSLRSVELCTFFLSLSHVGRQQPKFNRTRASLSVASAFLMSFIWNQIPKMNSILFTSVWRGAVDTVVRFHCNISCWKFSTNWAVAFISPHLKLFIFFWCHWIGFANWSALLFDSMRSSDTRILSSDGNRFVWATHNFWFTASHSIAHVRRTFAILNEWILVVERRRTIFIDRKTKLNVEIMKFAHGNVETKSETKWANGNEMAAQLTSDARDWTNEDESKNFNENYWPKLMIASRKVLPNQLSRSNVEMIAKYCFDQMHCWVGTNNASISIENGLQSQIFHIEHFAHIKPIELNEQAQKVNIR